MLEFFKKRTKGPKKLNMDDLALFIRAVATDDRKAIDKYLQMMKQLDQAKEG